MSAKKKQDTEGKPPRTPAFRPIRAAVFRGLAVVLPPLLTIVILIWVLGTIQRYVLEPVRIGARNVIAWSIADIKTEKQLRDQLNKQGRQLERVPTGEAGETVTVGDVTYQPVTGKEKTTYIPDAIYEQVAADPGEDSMPVTAKGIYRRYVELHYLRPYQVIPYFVCGFILVMYLLGKFMAAGVGRFFYGFLERGIARLPFIRKVYSSVKQVSDFLLSDRQMEYSRVVAVEWPRKGIWTLALVTGSSFKDIQAAAKEEVLSVLVPTSPMPMTGFTVTVRKSETVDLDITIDQAIQFIVSCGVVVPSERVDKMRAPAGTSSELVATSEPSPSGDS